MPEGGGFKSRLTGPALGMLAVGLVLLLWLTWGLFWQIELKTLDMRFAGRAEIKQSPLLVHVDVDDTTIRSFGRWLRWPRTRHAHLVRLLKELGARAVVFDIEFSEPSNPEEDEALTEDRPTGTRKPSEDRVFADALNETTFSFMPFRLEFREDSSPETLRLEERIRERLRQKFDATAMDIAAALDAPLESVDQRLVTLKKSLAFETGWQILDENGTLTDAMLLDRLLPRSDVQSFEKKNIIPAEVDRCLSLKHVYETAAKPLPVGFDPGLFQTAVDIRPPLSTLTEGCIGFGASNAPPDAEDGVIRHVSLFIRQGDRLLPHLSLVAACWLVGAPKEGVEVVPGRHVVIHPTNDAAGGTEAIFIPIDGQCRTVVNWAGTRRTTWPELFKHVPYGVVLELQTLRENLEDNDKVFRLTDEFLRKEYTDFRGGQWPAANRQAKKLAAQAGLSAEDRDVLKELLEAQHEAERQMFDTMTRRVAQEEARDATTLSEDDRARLEYMKRLLKVIPDVWDARKELSTRASHLEQRLAELVRDRLCIVGMTASGSTDLKPTPIQPVFPGVGVHSSVINSILQRRFIYRAPGWLNVVFVVVVGLTVSLFTSTLATRWAAAASLATLLGWTGIAYFAFTTWGWWVAMSAPVMAGFLAYAAITAYRQLTEERQKRHIRNTFQHYLAPTVVEEVLKNPDALKLGGERKELTVFFSDVAGFTPICEHMEPEELVALLNEYLSEMSEVILNSKGYINKYEGDAIMAVFGAPLPDPEHAVAACRVALESQRRLMDLREKLIREQRPIIRARIGINSGIMIVGNMGSRKLFDYTVMGDNVNIGARLETASKHFGTEIIIGENTFHAVKHVFETRRLGQVHVKGRSKPVGAYELLAEKGNCPPLVARLLPYYGEGLAAYAEQRWDEAVKAFTECLKINPNDGPSRAYLTRSTELRDRETVGHWDGTFTLESR